MQCVFMVTDLFCGLFPLLASAALNLVKQFTQNCTVHQFISLSLYRQSYLLLENWITLKRSTKIVVLSKRCHFSLIKFGAFNR